MASPHLPPPPLLDAGWYPDPTSRYEARYWDGRKWTSHISHYGATGADPLLRARFDYWWVRVLGRVALWGLVIAVGFWAFGRYWPDDRDLDADRELARAAAATPVGVPAGWLPDLRDALSPLTLEVNDGSVELPECESFADLAGDGTDQPRTSVAWAEPVGVQAFAQEVVVWGDQGAAEDHLADLRRDETALCLSALWVSALAGEDRELTVTSAVAQIDPSFGDEAVWWRLVGNVSEGLPLDLYVDVVVVRTGRIVTTYRFSSTIDPVPAELQRDVMSERMQQAGLLLAAADADDSDPDTTAETTTTETSTSDTTSQTSSSDTTTETTTAEGSVG